MCASAVSAPIITICSAETAHVLAFRGLEKEAAAGIMTQVFLHPHDLSPRGYSHTVGAIC